MGIGGSVNSNTNQNSAIGNKTDCKIVEAFIELINNKPISWQGLDVFKIFKHSIKWDRMDIAQLALEQLNRFDQNQYESLLKVCSKHDLTGQFYQLLPKTDANNLDICLMIAVRKVNVVMTRHILNHPFIGGAQVAVECRLLEAVESKSTELIDAILGFCPGCNLSLSIKKSIRERDDSETDIALHIIESIVRIQHNLGDNTYQLFEDCAIHGYADLFQTLLLVKDVPILIDGKPVKIGSPETSIIHFEDSQIMQILLLHKLIDIDIVNNPDSQEIWINNIIKNDDLISLKMYVSQVDLDKVTETDSSNKKKLKKRLLQSAASYQRVSIIEYLTNTLKYPREDLLTEFQWSLDLNHLATVDYFISVNVVDWSYLLRWSIDKGPSVGGSGGNKIYYRTFAKSHVCIDQLTPVMRVFLDLLAMAPVRIVDYLRERDTDAAVSLLKRCTDANLSQYDCEQLLTWLSVWNRPDHVECLMQRTPLTNRVLTECARYGSTAMTKLLIDASRVRQEAVDTLFADSLWFDNRDVFAYFLSNYVATSYAPTISFYLRTYLLAHDMKVADLILKRCSASQDLHLGVLLHQLLPQLQTDSDEEVVIFLIEKMSLEMDPDVMTRALDLTVRMNRVDVARVLIKKFNDSKINLPKLALSMSDKPSSAMIKLVLENSPVDCERIIQIILTTGDLESMKNLLQMYPDYDLDSLRMRAVEMDSVYLFEYLTLEMTASSEQLDKYLQVAISKRLPDIVRVLVKAGIDIVKNKQVINQFGLKMAALDLLML